MRIEDEGLRLDRQYRWKMVAPGPPRTLARARRAGGPPRNLSTSLSNAALIIVPRSLSILLEHKFSTSHTPEF